MVQLLCSSSRLVPAPASLVELEYSIPSRPACQADSRNQAAGTYPMIQGPLDLDGFHRTVVPYRSIGHHRVLGHLGRLQDPGRQPRVSHLLGDIPGIIFLWYRFWTD